MNSIYGKSNENTRNRLNVDLVNDETDLIKKCSSQRLKNIPVMINEELAMVNLVKKEVKLNKPIYIGGAVLLGLSKLYMYQFWYDVLKKKYPNCKLMYT